MKLQRLMLADIEPYRNNPRKNDEAVNAVAESIRQCSYITPIIRPLGVLWINPFFRR